MGISKAKGMAWAKARSNFGGRVFVMTGDGELQEGQILVCKHVLIRKLITLPRSLIGIFVRQKIR